MRIFAKDVDVHAIYRAVLVALVVLLGSVACGPESSDVEPSADAQADVEALQARLDSLEERIAEQPDDLSADEARSMMSDMRGATDMMGTLMDRMGPETMDPSTMSQMQSMMGRMEGMAAQMEGMMGGMRMGEMMGDGASMDAMMEHMHEMHGDLDAHAGEGHMH